MATRDEFEKVAPAHLRGLQAPHAATGKLCMPGTLRPDGFPRISPVEPGLFEGQLWIVHLDITMRREGRGERTVRKVGVGLATERIRVS